MTASIRGLHSAKGNASDQDASLVRGAFLLLMSENFKYQIFEGELLNPLRGHDLTDLERFIGVFLWRATSEIPFTIADIQEAVERSLGDRIGVRTVKGVIRRLRKEHAFPIVASRSEPAGYWWCASAEEMKQFIEQFSAQARDEFHTLSRMVKNNYPELAGQLTLEDANGNAG